MVTQKDVVYIFNLHASNLSQCLRRLLTSVVSRLMSRNDLDQNMLHISFSSSCMTSLHLPIVHQTYASKLKIRLSNGILAWKLVFSATISVKKAAQNEKKEMLT